MDRRVHVLISGRVQGVAYRAAMKAQAGGLGLSGWARNLPDGRVEATAQGSEEHLQDLLTWCHRGPPAARVNDVTATWHDPDPSLTGFEVTS